MVAPAIAVVDDDQDFRTLLAEVLDGEGYRPHLATTDSAWDVISRVRPAVILLDIGWPSLERQRQSAGLSLSLLLEQSPATRGIPIIVCSGDHRALQVHGESLRARSCEVLEKPFDLDDLLEAVDAVIEGRGCPSADPG